MKNKRLFSLLLSAAVTFSLSANAFALTTADKDAWTGAGGQVVAGDAQLQGIVTEYQIPTNVLFAINPYQAGDATKSQIYSPDYTIINKSNVPIKASVRASVKGTDNTIKIKQSIMDVNITDPTVTSKDAYVELVSATSVQPTVTAVPNAAATIGTTSIVNPEFILPTDGATSGGADTGAKAILPVAVTANLQNAASTASAGLLFGLNAGTFTDTDGDPSTTNDTLIQSLGTDGVASFRFMGAVNPAVTWAANDLSIQIIYDITGMNTAMYDDVQTNADTKVSESGQNAVVMLGDTSAGQGVTGTFSAGKTLKFNIVKGTGNDAYAKLVSVKCSTGEFANQNLATPKYFTYNWTNLAPVISMEGTITMIRSITEDTTFTFTFANAAGTELSPVDVSITYA